MVAMFNLCFLAGKLSQIGVFTAAGLLTAPLAGLTAGLSVLAAAALWTGMRLQDRIPAERYRQAVKAVLLVLALVLVAQYLAEVW